MEQYKVWILNKTKKVIVFNGEKDENMDIFSEEERKLLIEDPIFSPVLIHKDDSVEQVKQKILNELGCIFSPHFSKNCEAVSTNYDELYLFAYKTRTINFLNAITTSTKSVIHKKIFAQFARNIDSDEYIEPNKEIYEYKYLASLGEQSLSIKTGLGMEFKNGYNYLFSPNPFLNDPSVENDKIVKSIYLNENKLLGSIDDNNIYVCLAKDVFQYAEKMGFPSDLFANLYFPRLASAQIFSSEDLIDAQEELQQKTDAIMVEEQFASYEIIDTLYAVSEPLPNEKHGINRFDIEIVPSHKLVMPLDAIFKNIHCDAEFPFIKYNPGVRRENIYRLYSAAVSKTGKKIPYLPKKKIESLMRTTSNHKQISIYNMAHRLIISIESDGAVKIIGEFKEDDVKPIEEIETIIKSSVNPVIEKMNRYLMTSGYHISTIASLKDENLKIVNIKYQYSVKLAKKFVEIRSSNNAFVLNNVEYRVKKGIYNVESFVEELMRQLGPKGFLVTHTDRLRITHEDEDFTIDVSKKDSLDVLGFDKHTVLESMNLSLTMPKQVVKIAKMDLQNTCVYPVFWVEKSNVKKEAVLRFVRVDNFQKMNSLATFISDMYKKQGKEEDAYNALVAQHGIELNQAKKLVAKILSDTNIASLNPGLLTTMKLEDDVLKVVVHNLTSVDYIETLGMYVNSIVRITQEMVDVLDVCGSKKNMEVDAVAEAEEAEEEAEAEELDVRKQIEQFIGKPKIASESESDSDSSLQFHDFELGSSDSEMSGGAGSDSDDSDDESVKGKKYFLKRLTKSDPVLFKEVNKKNGKIGRYTRTCPSMQQPVVISNEEKEHIDKNYRDSYNKDTALPYGSSKDKKNWYICPQFWCFKTNAPMSQQDIDAGKCGDVKDRKKNVFEFTDKKHKNPDGSYRNFNPGFIVNHHPNKDLCLPCCYAEWDSRMHKERRDKCLNPEDKAKLDKEEKEKPDDKQKPEAKPDDKRKPNVATEIMGYNSTLTPGRWGYLPVSIRRFMQIKYKPDDSMQFLRYGVQNHSFIACLADIYGKIHNNPAPTIVEMRKIIADSVSLEDYKKYGKGSFVRLFSKNPGKDTLTESYDNFRKYLLGKDSIIDHTYLWDIISTPNKKLFKDKFKDGLNLVIMEIVNNDITDKVNIICPLSSYVKNRFIKDRDTIFLINQGTQYEPVYLVDKTSKNKNAKTHFNLVNTLKIPNIHNLLITLDNTLNKYCEPSRKIKEYIFKSPMEVGELIHQIVDTKGYSIAKQVVNYHDRTVALLVETPSKKHIVIPCEPSESQDYPVEYMDDPALWSDYKTTLEELMALKETNANILCEPVVKMTENGLIVGFLTETNQFIKINHPHKEEEDDDDDGLKTHSLINQKQNPHRIEMTIDNSTSEDPERIRVVRNITLESNFFALYRVTIKSLLEDREHRESVISTIENANSSYKEKLENVKQIIDTITKEAVSYYVNKMPESLLNKLLDISNYDKNKTSGFYIDGRLGIPKKNLISEKDNSLIYPYRVADEIVRFGRIQNFILNNQFLNTGNTDFKINRDEFIISESALGSKDYFDDMINKNTNEYRPFNTTNGIPYDMAKTKLYLPLMVEKEKEKEVVVEKVAENCLPTIEKYYLSSNGKNYWAGKVFPEKQLTDKLVFKANETCSFGPLIHIMKRFENKEYTIKELKEMVWNAYSDYLTYKKQIILLLKNQGKTKVLKNYNNDLEGLIKSEDYFLTSLDVWVFAQKYRVPIILFSSTNMLIDVLLIQGERPAIDAKDYLVDERITNKNTKFGYSWIVLGGAEEDKFFFYLSPSSKIRVLHTIHSNAIIGSKRGAEYVAESFHKNQLGEFQQQLEQNPAFSFEDFLKARP